MPLKLILIAIFASVNFIQAQTKADIVLHNGPVYTVEDDQLWARGIAIWGNQIRAVFSDDSEAADYIGPDTKVIDLAGRLALPGFIDAHTHFAGFAEQQQDIMLMRVDSDEGLIAELERVVPLVGEGQWITGGQWSGAIQWDAGLGEIDEGKRVRWRPNRRTIDSITEKNPCFLSSYDRDLHLANTAALRAAGLEAAKLEGMELEDGVPTGLIHRGSPALARLRAVVKPKSQERILNEYRTGLRLLAEMGIVEFHDMFRGFDHIERLLILQEAGELTARIWERPWLDLSEQMYERGLKMGMHPATKERDFFFRYGGFKSANDGMLGSRGAMLFQVYADRPDYKGHYQEYNSDAPRPGSLIGNPQVFYEYCKAAVEHGFSVDSHAIGDRGISEVIDVLERIHEDLDADMSMFRIIHAEIVQPREFDRMKALNLIAETNPSQLPDDMRWLRARLGSERVKLAFPFRSFIDKGIVMSFGSDVPGNAGAIFFNHPKYVLNAAVNRTNEKGEPAGGWQPQHKISMAEAIKAFTLNAAYACLREDRVRGSIKVGKLADIAVIDRNILAEPEMVLEMNVDLTIVDGRIVFER